MFPFTLKARETPHFTSSPYDFRKAFLANKPESLSWFAYDVVVASPTDVEFVVYDMRDFCRGGIGKEIARFEAKVGRGVTRASIEHRALYLAQERRNAELEAAEAEVVRTYAAEIMAEIAA